MIRLNNLSKVISEFALKLQESYKQTLVYEEINASYELYESIEVVTVTSNYTKYSVVFKALDYFKSIEEGTKPGTFVNYSDILKWIKIKPVFPRPNDKGITPTDNQLAFLIARSIHNKGIKAKPILQNNVEKLLNEYAPLFKKAVEEDHSVNITKMIRLSIQPIKIKM